METIFVFKTNITSDTDLDLIGCIMQKLGIINWNVDRDDIDCVLRVVTSQYSEPQLINEVALAGFTCEELE